MRGDYSEAVAKLLTLGQTDIHDEDDYLEMGFTGADIPELIRLVEDTELRNLPWGEEGEVPPEVYAQVHAWRTLGQLEAVEAIPALIGLLHWIDDDGDDFVGEEVPVMLGKMGAVAIQPCRDTLADRTRKEFERIAAGTALVEIGKQHPEAREACVQALMSTLENYRDDDTSVNAFTLSNLTDLEAVEAAPLAKEIFEAECADETVMGDFEDFQVKVGLLEERITPDKGPSRAQLKQMLSAFKNVEPARQHKVNKAKKEKARRKQEKKARRRNRKR